MSKSTKPRQPIAPKRDAKAELTAFLAERRRAYAEAVFVAFCQNPEIVNAGRPSKDVARDAIEYADALVEALFLKPLEEEAKEMIDWLGRQGEQKPVEWSEEDEVNLQSVIDAISATYKWDRIINWLKSLRHKNYIWQKERFVDKACDYL